MGGTTVIDDVVARLSRRLAERLRLYALILFGSRAHGVAAPESDYDFVVVSPDFEGVPFLERGRLLLPLREPGVSYDFLCYTPEEFGRLASQATMVRDIAREGRWLVRPRRRRKVHAKQPASRVE